MPAMKIFTPLVALWFGILLLSGMIPSTLFAQEKPAETEAADKAPPAEAQPAADAPPSDEKPEGEEAKPVPLSKTLVSPLTKVPKTPAELFDAVMLMTDLARPDLAKVYLKKLLTLPPKDEDILQLRRELGPTIFLKLANIKELQPESIDLLNRVNKVIGDHMANPATSRRMLDDLRGSADARDAAFVELRAAGELTVPAILVELQDPAAAELRTTLTELLVKIGKPAVPQLIAAVDTPDEELRARVIRILGDIEDPRATQHLWYFAVAPQMTEGVRTAARAALTKLTGHDVAPEILSGQVSEKLRELARLYYRGQPIAPPDLQGKVTFWLWDKDRKTVVARRMDPHEATQLWALRFARRSLELSPKDEEIQTVFLTGALGYETHEKEGIWITPENPGSAFELAVAAGPELISKVLEVALEDRRMTAAVGALRALARNATMQQLHGSGTHLAPMVRALDDPDLRVQYEAAQAIIAIRPSSGFRNHQRVIAILARCLTDSVEPPRQALVIDPNTSRGVVIAGLVQGIGYQSSLSHNGREGFRRASEGNAPDLIMVNAQVGQWPLTETIANFRADSRTRQMPIVIFGDESLKAKYALRTARDSRLYVIREPYSVADLENNVKDFLASQTVTPLSPAERQRESRGAAEALNFVVRTPLGEIFSLAGTEQLIIQGTRNPALVYDLLAPLATFSTADAQQRLADIVVDEKIDMAERIQAARLLATHVQKNSLLITADSVNRLRTLWRSGDPDLRTPLASLIGALKPNSTLIGEHLLLYRPEIKLPKAE
ncbi:MAG: HEAT repeat domain-containing protein [Planctomycetales bacterium]